MKIIEAIESVRKEKRITQKELCSHLGMTTQNYINYVKGRSSPTVHMVVSICDYLGMEFNFRFDPKSENL